VGRYSGGKFRLSFGFYVEAARGLGTPLKGLSGISEGERKRACVGDKWVPDQNPRREKAKGPIVTKEKDGNELT